MSLSIKAEPALWVALVQAAVALAVSFGLELSPQQVGSIVALTAAATAVFLRRHVTPSPPPPPAPSPVGVTVTEASPVAEPRPADA